MRDQLIQAANVLVEEARSLFVRFVRYIDTDTMKASFDGEITGISQALHVICLYIDDSGCRSMWREVQALSFECTYYDRIQSLLEDYPNNGER